jgi:hypothetical protein
MIAFAPCVVTLAVGGVGGVSNNLGSGVVLTADATIGAAMMGNGASFRRLRGFRFDFGDNNFGDNVGAGAGTGAILASAICKGDFVPARRARITSFFNGSKNIKFSRDFLIKQLEQRTFFIAFFYHRFFFFE